MIYLHEKEQRKIKIEPRIKLNYNIYKGKYMVVTVKPVFGNSRSSLFSEFYFISLNNTL